MINSNYKPIKLRAEDDNDLEILSKCLFEAICFDNEMKFLKEKKIGIMTAVNPRSRFGIISIKGQKNIYNFDEKSLIKNLWVNAGFYIFNKNNMHMAYMSIVGGGKNACTLHYVKNKPAPLD